MLCNVVSLFMNFKTEPRIKKSHGKTLTRNINFEFFYFILLKTMKKIATLDS